MTRCHPTDPGSVSPATWAAVAVLVTLDLTGKSGHEMMTRPSYITFGEKLEGLDWLAGNCGAEIPDTEPKPGSAWVHPGEAREISIRIVVDPPQRRLSSETYAELTQLFVAFHDGCCWWLLAA